MKTDRGIEIGNNISKWRKIRGIKQSEMAEKLGISRTSYAYIENGHSNHKYKTIETIAKILELDVMQLTSGKKAIHSELEVLDMKVMSIEQLKKLISVTTDELIRRIGEEQNETL